MTTPPAQPKASLAAYSADEIASIVNTRCQELSPQLGWTVTAPAVKIVEPDALQEAIQADVRVRAEKVRGRPRDEGLFASVASWLLGFIVPSTLGYFGTSTNTLYLNGELAPQQAGYVLMHELVHAAQWQNFPALFARIDTVRVSAEDLADEFGEDAEVARAARDRYESLVTFLEGHATFHGRRACERRLLRDAPNVPAEEARAFVEALMALDKADETTALIYVRGEETLAGLDAAKVDALFRDPNQILKLFTRRRAAQT